MRHMEPGVLCGLVAILNLQAGRGLACRRSVGNQLRISYYFSLLWLLEKHHCFLASNYKGKGQAAEQQSCAGLGLRLIPSNPTAPPIIVPLPMRIQEHHRIPDRNHPNSPAQRLSTCK